MTYIRVKVPIPDSIYEQGDFPQWEGKIEENDVEVYYDDYISRRSVRNQYAVFSYKGFHGWLSLGFTMSEIVNCANLESSNCEEECKKYIDDDAGDEEEF